jgi:hypothetical protein
MQALSGTATSSATPEAAALTSAALQEGVAAHPEVASRPGRTSGEQPSRPQHGPRGEAALDGPGAAVCSFSSCSCSSLENSATLCLLGEGHTGDSEDSLPGAWLAELPPGRLRRLCCNPGLLSLQEELTRLSRWAVSRCLSSHLRSSSFTTIQQRTLLIWHSQWAAVSRFRCCVKVGDAAGDALQPYPTMSPTMTLHCGFRSWDGTSQPTLSSSPCFGVSPSLRTPGLGCVWDALYGDNLPGWGASGYCAQVLPGRVAPGPQRHTRPRGGPSRWRLREAQGCGSPRTLRLPNPHAQPPWTRPLDIQDPLACGGEPVGEARQVRSQRSWFGRRM